MGSKNVDSHVEQIAPNDFNGYLNKGDAQDRDQARELVANWVNGSAEEKALVRKLDWRILVSVQNDNVSTLTPLSHVVGCSTS